MSDDENQEVFNSFQMDEEGIDFHGEEEVEGQQHEKEVNVSLNFEEEGDNPNIHQEVNHLNNEKEENNNNSKENKEKEKNDTINAVETENSGVTIGTIGMSHPHTDKNLHYKNKPSLCELILENINKQHREGAVSLPNSPDKVVNEKLVNNCNTLDRISTNDSHNNMEKSLASSAVMNNISENIHQISPSSSSNSVLVTAQKRVPMLLNNLKTMYDLNSDRVKKRSEQMKKRKERLEDLAEDIENTNTNDNPQINNINQNLMTNFNEVSNHLGVSDSKRTIRVNTNKKYLEEEEERKSLNNTESNKVLSESSASGNNIAEIIDRDNKEETEVVVSDLECEIEEEDPAVLNTSTKSFIPLQNHLRSKRAVSVDKATPSYLMALYQYEESDSNKNSLNNSINAGSDFAKGDGEERDNYYLNLGNNRHNYQVDDVIEEETSENNTDTELSARKRSSLYFYGGNQRSTDSNALSNAYSSSPVHTHKRFTIGSNHTAYKQNYNTFHGGFHDIKEDAQKSFKSKRRQHHKASKSEYTNFRVDMKKMLENLEKRRLCEKDEKIQKMQMRKNMLLNRFLKSNSQHNLPTQSNIACGSNGVIKRHSEKTLSICTPSSQVIENLFKKLSPSGASREKFYYEYEGEDGGVSNAELIKINFEDPEDSGNENENSNENITNENISIREEDIVQNNSIIEIKDEDVNFEAELNNQMQKNAILEDELIDNSAFNFNPTPIESKVNTAEKKRKLKSIFESEDMVVSQGDKFDVVQEGSNLNNTSNQFNFSTNQNPNFNFPISSNKSITITNSSNNFLEILNTGKKNSNPFIVSNSISLQISSQTVAEDFSKTGSCNNLNQNKSKTVYNNNYINNNINNISISIVNGSNDSSSHGNKIKKVTRQKNNSITHDIRQKYMGHYKTPSICVSKVHEEKARSNSVSKNITSSSQISIPGINSINAISLNTPLSINQSVHNNFEYMRENNNAGSSQKNKKNSMRHSGLNTPKKNKFISARGDLKHFLMYSDTKVHDTNNFTVNTNSKDLIIMNSFNSLSNLISSHTGVDSNPRVNSETSVNSILNSSNKQIIHDAMKVLKFQVSSLDHQKFSLEKLTKSKAKLFCLLISNDSSDSHFEFKGLYEMNVDKNNLTKIYSVNYYPTNIDFNEVKCFYQFSYEAEGFKFLSDVKRLSSEIHGFFMQYNYKKFLKG